MKQSNVKLPGDLGEADIAGLNAHNVAIRLNNRAELKGELFLARGQRLQDTLMSERRFLTFRGLDGRLRSISKEMIAEIAESRH